MCAPVIRERRAQEIDEAVSRATELGWTVVFPTLTVPHHREDLLRPRLGVVAGSLGVCLKGTPWERRKRSLGYVGGIRAVETPWGPVNGWHPHSHSLLMFDRHLSDGEVQQLGAWMLGRWRSVCERRGFGVVNGAAFMLRRVYPGTGSLGDYLTAVEGGWGIGREIARGDLKRSGSSTLAPPVDLLRAYVQHDNQPALRLWREYEEATRGRRAVVWSPGLRDRLAMHREKSDDELAASEGQDVTLVRASFVPRQWNHYMGTNRLGRVLCKVEEISALFIWMASVMGNDIKEVSP